MSKYFARNDEDRGIDKTIRDSIVEDGSKTSMAMYLQGQEQLNLLRTLIVEQGVMMDELGSMKTLVEKTTELYESYNERVVSSEVYSELDKGLKRVERKINDLMEYICESEDIRTIDTTGFDQELIEDAIAIVRERGLRARHCFVEDPTALNKRKSDAWDYILCCVEACK